MRVVKRGNVELKKVPKGDRRRLSDGRNAWRKMTPEQRREFIDWMNEENLEVAPPKEK